MGLYMFTWHMGRFFFFFFSLGVRFCWRFFLFKDMNQSIQIRRCPVIGPTLSIQIV